MTCYCCVYFGNTFISEKVIVNSDIECDSVAKKTRMRDIEIKRD